MIWNPSRFDRALKRLFFTTRPTLVQITGNMATFHHILDAQFARSPYVGHGVSGMTTMASSQSQGQKSTYLINDASGHLARHPRLEPDTFLLPVSPPLSAPTSVINSPPSSRAVTAPGEASVYFGHDQVDDVKSSCEPDYETMGCSGGWFWCGSPPLTPVFNESMSMTTQHADLWTVPTCSPAPSPMSSTMARMEFDYRDPKPTPSSMSATVPKAEFDLCHPSDLVHPIAQHVIDFPDLPTLCAGDDEEHKTMLGEIHAISQPIPPSEGLSCFPGSNANGLPTFDDLSSFDPEQDSSPNFAHFSPPDHPNYPGSKRRRTVPVSLDAGNFLSDAATHGLHSADHFPFNGLPTPSVSEPSRRGSDQSFASSNENGDASSTTSICVSEADAFDRELASYEDDSCGSACGVPELQHGSSSTTPSSDGLESVPTPTPASRRGRKQSLTEDPSKTFVCDLCSRRFRRQEHLKRHYRSLHTQEKPFECNECGKKFSRSDNLAQHARTHGSGAIVMGVLEGGEVLARDPSESTDDDDLFRAGFYPVTHPSMHVPLHLGLVSHVPDGLCSFSGETASRKKRRRGD
ncbi:MAG: hypothetical protein M1826_001674 [Phylliscum demangeonii]|nr:MAG: hypothetical protein M1826_001674 [Phylliscum demangeonii]